MFQISISFQLCIALRMRVFVLVLGPVPDEVMEALIATEALWVPGVRLLDPCCGISQTQGKFLRKTIGDMDLRRQSRETSRPTFRFVELFAGVGGFRLGMERLGGQCVFASEMDREARAVYTVRSKGCCISCKIDSSSVIYFTSFALFLTA